MNRREFLEAVAAAAVAGLNVADARALRKIALTCRHRASRESEVRVDAWQMLGDCGAKLCDGLSAPTGRDEHVSEPHVRLRVARIRFEDLPQGALELRTLQLS